MKVCIVTPSLGVGGVGKAASVQSVMFKNLGYEVHIVLISNIITYKYEGNLFNLGAIKDKRNSFLDKVRRILLLRKYLLKHQFDYVIDNRMRTNATVNEIGMCKYAYRNFKVVYVSHSFSYIKDVDNNPRMKKWLINKAYKIVAVNKELSSFIKNLHPFHDVVCIENAIDIEYIKAKGEAPFVKTNPYILYCGRLEERCKNISMLIRAYAKSKVYNDGIELLILGDGLDKPKYEALVLELGISDYVIFQAFTSNPYVYMKNAICTALTSLYEGFGLVLVESLAVGTPVVAVDCRTGPSEIIQNGVNGILMKNHDEETYSEALKTMVYKNSFLQELKKQAEVSVEKFGIEQISKKWQSLLEVG